MLNNRKDWGEHRVCTNCGCHFYDFNKSGCSCPRCELVFDIKAVLKEKFGRLKAAFNKKSNEEVDEEFKEDGTSEDSESNEFFDKDFEEQDAEADFAPKKLDKYDEEE